MGVGWLHSPGGYTLTGTDCDDAVDAVDALFVLQYVVGLRDELGCPDLQVVKQGSIPPGRTHQEVRP